MYFYSLYSPFTGPPPPALNPPIDKAVTVHFHEEHKQSIANIPAINTHAFIIAIHDDNRLIITV